MDSKQVHSCAIIVYLLVFSASCTGLAAESEWTQTAQLDVDASWRHARMIPQTLFGLFFEEINHAGAGGIWAELVSNRGFEAGGPRTPSNIDPWSIIGDESSIHITTDHVSPFTNNTVALRMEVLCDNCPLGGVGIYNPGFWGMNIEAGKTYNLVMYAKSLQTMDLTVSLKNSDGSETLATSTMIIAGTSNWTKLEQKIVPKGTNRTARLQITTNKKVVVWFDQVSLMPADTYKAAMVSAVEPLLPVCKSVGGGSTNFGIDFCMSALGSDSRSRNTKDEVELSSIAVDLVTANATSTAAKIDGLIRKQQDGGKGDATARGLVSCQALYRDILQRQPGCAAAIKGSRFNEATSSLEKSASAAKECESGFSNSNVASPLTVEDNNAFMLAKLAVALLDFPH